MMIGWIFLAIVLLGLIVWIAKKGWLPKLASFGCFIKLIILAGLIIGVGVVATQSCGVELPFGCQGSGSGEKRDLPSIEEYPYGVIVESGSQKGVYIVTTYQLGTGGEIVISNYYVMKNDKEGYYYEDVLVLSGETVRVLLRH